MTESSHERNRRVLVIDDNHAIHDDFRKILGPGCTDTKALDAAEAALFGQPTAPSAATGFELDSAMQGRDGLERVQQAVAAGRPYAMAFIDVRMPPGWDGIETTARIWEIDPDLQVVICTAYSDYSWDDMIAKVGRSDRLVILKKPFDNVEVLQLANALTEKWRLHQQVRTHIAGLETAVQARTAELRKSEERFRLIAENVADLISVVDAHGNRLYSSPSYETILGYSTGDLKSGVLLDQIHPEDRPRVVTAVEQAFATGVAQPAEYRMRHKNGAWRTLESSASAIRDGTTGQAGKLVIVARDITGRKDAETRLQRAHAEAEAMLSTISAILIGVDVEGRIARWNAAAEQAFGIPAGLAFGKQLEDCGIRWDWPTVKAGIVNCLGRGQAFELNDLTYQRASGKDGCLHLILTPSAGLGADGLNFVLLGMDTTQQRLLEGQLRQAQKLESIGQLAAGIAHEINTPTQFIGDNLRFMQDGFNDLRKALDQLPRLLQWQRQDPAAPAGFEDARAAVEAADLNYLMSEIPKAIEQSLDGTTRVARIVQAMKDFSHPDAGDKKPINLNQAIEATATVARNEWKYVAELEMHLDPVLPPVPCLAGEINQVILNLVVNAAHAIADTHAVKQGGKGTITLATRRDGAWVEIRVGDTGGGIPENIRDKVCDPFFTTKPVGKGTGQGLFIAHNVVVEKHGGTLTFETETGKGTTFIIRLPLAPAQPNHLAA